MVALLLLTGCDDDGHLSIPPDPEPMLAPMQEKVLVVGAFSDGYLYALDMRTFEPTRLVPGFGATPTPEGGLVSVHSAGLVEWVPGEAGYRPIIRTAPGGERYDDQFRSPTLSRDGAHIAYDDGLGGLYVIDRSGGIPVASFVGTNLFDGYEHPSFGIGDTLYFSGRSDDAGLYASAPPWTEIERVDFFAPAPRWPAVSPDGSEILVMLGDQLFRIDTRGRTSSTVGMQARDGCDPFWLPDGEGYGFGRLWEGRLDDVVIVRPGEPELSLLTENYDWLFDTAWGLAPGVAVW